MIHFSSFSVKLVYFTEWIIVKWAIFQLHFYFDFSLNDSVSINDLTMVLKIISTCEVKHVMTLPIKTITLVLNVLTYLIRLSAILVLVSVSTFKNGVILYVFQTYFTWSGPSINVVFNKSWSSKLMSADPYKPDFDSTIYLHVLSI